MILDGPHAAIHTLTAERDAALALAERYRRALTTSSNRSQHPGDDRLCWQRWPDREWLWCLHCVANKALRGEREERAR